MLKNFIFFYKFTASAERNVIQQGMDDITSNTCITFKARTSEANYVRIVRGAANSGCWSYVGRLGGAQQLNLQPGSPGCVFKGTKFLVVLICIVCGEYLTSLLIVSYN